MRLRHVKNADEIIKNTPNIAITDPENYRGKWRELYPEAKAIYLEVGAGKGQFLTSSALNNPDILYIGIEKMTSVICRAIVKASNLKLTNCIFALGVGEKLLDYFEPGEIDRVYLSFPDPWPKARHEKRRLTSVAFLKEYAIILSENGVLRLKTDNYDLFTYSKETMLPLLKDSKSGERVYEDGELTTEFEDKFRALGQKIYFIEGSFRRENVTTR